MDKFVLKSPQTAKRPVVDPSADRENVVELAAKVDPPNDGIPPPLPVNSPPPLVDITDSVDEEEMHASNSRKRPQPMVETGDADNVPAPQGQSVDSPSTSASTTPRNVGKRPRVDLSEKKRLEREDSRRRRDEEKAEKQRQKEEEAQKRAQDRADETRRRAEEKAEKSRKYEEDKAEAARLRDEKKGREAEEREQKKKEREEAKEREKVEKENKKKVEKEQKEEEKERQRKADADAKEVERLAKIAKKEDDRRRVVEEKEQERLAAEAAKQKKIQGSVNIMASFMSKAKPTPTTPKATAGSALDGKFGVFELKDGMIMAPTTRRTIDKAEKEHLDQLLVDQSTPVDGLYLRVLRGVDYEGRRSDRTPDSAPKNDADALPGMDDVQVIDSKESLNYRVKYLHFHTNFRPPYYGTFRKRSTLVTGRRPFGRAVEPSFDYEVDSDDEWADAEEDPDDAENLSDDDMMAQSGDEEDEDENDGFMVAHGYLSEGEGEGEEDLGGTAEERRERLAAKALAWKLAHDPDHLLKQHTYVIGPWWPNEKGEYPGREPLLAQKLTECKGFVVGQPMTSFNWREHSERILGPPVEVAEAKPEGDNGEVVEEEETEEHKKTPKCRSIRSMFAEIKERPKVEAKRRIPLQSTMAAKSPAPTTTNGAPTEVIDLESNEPKN